MPIFNSANASIGKEGAVPPTANISHQHMINVFEVFGWALADTVRELDHVQHREDISAENFMAVLASKVERLDSNARRLGVDVKFVSELVAALHDTVSSTPDRSPKERASPRLVWSRPDGDHQ